MDIKSHIDKRISKGIVEELVLLKEDLAKLVSTVNKLNVDSSLLRVKIGKLMAASSE